MNKIICVIIFLFATQHTIHTQTVEPSASIDKNILQIETQSVYTIKKEASIKTKSWSIPSILFRYGLPNGFELQLNTSILKEQLWEFDHLLHVLNKFDDTQIGFSMNLLKEKQFLPETSIMFRLILPINKNFKFDKMGEIVSLNFSNSLSKNLSLNYNIGYTRETDNSSSGFYIINISYQPTPKLHFFIEKFGDLTNIIPISLDLNMGGGFNISDNLILDVSVSSGLNQRMFYAGGIITWVINVKKSKI